MGTISPLRLLLRWALHRGCLPYPLLLLGVCPWEGFVEGLLGENLLAEERRRDPYSSK